MSRRTVTLVVVALTLMVVIATLTSCGTPSPEQTDSSQGIGSVTSIADIPPTRCRDSVPVALIDRVRFTRLKDLVSDPISLIIEGTITGEVTRWIPDTSETNVELAERQARGEPTGVFVTDYEVTINIVLKGQPDSMTITVNPGPSEYSDTRLQVGDRVILFILGDASTLTAAPGQMPYGIVGPEGQFRIEKDNTLFAYVPLSCNPVADKYRGQDKSILEKDVLELVAKTTPTKEKALEKALNSSDIVIEGTIQGIREVRFINTRERPQEWIDQMFAEGKMPGLVLTDYTLTIDKVLFERPADPKFFPDRKSLVPSQTIIVTRQGGTYRGVTSVEEPGPPFEIGSREVLFLVPTSFADDDQVRYTIDSRMGRFLIGPDNTLIAFTTKGLGAFYDGQALHQLEQDIAEFLRTHPFGQKTPIPPQP